MLFALIGIISLLVSLGVCVFSQAFAAQSWIWVLPASFLGSFLTLSIAFFVTLLIMCKMVDMDKPQEKDGTFYRFMLRLTVSAIMILVQVRLHATGLEKTPKDGRFLLVCNHLNDMDPVVLTHCFPRSQLAFISKRENRDMFLVGPMMHKTLCQLINRENDREALKTILKCIQLIKDDMASVAVFPEGYIHGDNLLHPFRSGVFKIAQKAKVPIVVCTLQNTQHVFHNAKRLRPTRVEMHLLDVIPPESFEGITAVELGDRVYAMMANDLGRENCYIPDPS